MTDPSDDIHESRLRAEIGSPAADNPNWGPHHNYHASDVAFLLRRLDEARARLTAQEQATVDMMNGAEARHDARVTELLEANTREVERRRAVEAERDRAIEVIRSTAQRIDNTVAQTWKHGHTSLGEYLKEASDAAPQAGPRVIAERHLVFDPGDTDVAAKIAAAIEQMQAEKS